MVLICLLLQLARYLNRNYWEKKQEEVRKSPTPSAPLSLTEPAAQPGEAHPPPLGVVEVRGGLDPPPAASGGEEHPAPSLSPPRSTAGLLLARQGGLGLSGCPSLSSSTRTASLRRTTSSS